MALKIQFKKHIVLTTVLLLLVVFVAGVLLGRNLESRQYNTASKFIKENELNTESYIIEQELIENFGEDSCELAKLRIDDLSQELFNIGNRISSENAEEMLGQEKYNFLKREFHLMQIKTYILFKKITDTCSIDANVILYYYNTKDQDSEEQGLILDKIVENYDAKVFAIEYNYSKDISFLESYYGIDTTPSVIINYDKKYYGLTDYNRIALEMIAPRKLGDFNYD